MTDQELIGYYKRSRAVIIPQEEDFGLVAIEAQSFGIPVIAFGQGGSLETVKENITGLFFNKQTSDSLLATINKFENMKFNKRHCRDNVNKFSQANFMINFKKEYELAVKDFFS